MGCCTHGLLPISKPSPHHKSGPWGYYLVTAILAARSYIVETPAGLTRLNRAHQRSAALPPPGALALSLWMDKPSPSPVPAAEHSAHLPPTPSCSTCQSILYSASHFTSCPTCPSTPPAVRPSALDEPTSSEYCRIL